jgi:hypothetical protein
MSQTSDEVGDQSLVINKKLTGSFSHPGAISDLCPAHGLLRERLRTYPGQPPVLRGVRHSKQTFSVPIDAYLAFQSARCKDPLVARPIMSLGILLSRNLAGVVVTCS